jgi:hypothetical protein
VAELDGFADVEALSEGFAELEGFGELDGNAETLVLAELVTVGVADELVDSDG